MAALDNLLDLRHIIDCTRERDKGINYERHDPKAPFATFKIPIKVYLQIIKLTLVTLHLHSHFVVYLPFGLFTKPRDLGI